MPIPQETLDTLIEVYEAYDMVSRKDDPSMSVKTYAKEVYEAISAVHGEALKQAFQDANQEYTTVIYNSNILTPGQLKEMVSHWEI